MGDANEMEESARVYESVCSNELLMDRDVPKIVFMNKLDIESECSYNTANWKRLFQTTELGSKRNNYDDVVNVFGGSAKTGDGVRFAMEYLILAVMSIQKKR